MKAKIFGNSRVEGNVIVGGAKNAALPIIASAVLADREVEIRNVPDLVDVGEMIETIRKAGCETSFEGNTLTARCRDLKWDLSEISSKIRASVLLLGPIALRAGRCRLSHPGGCAIGKRPIDLHIEGLKALGFDVSETDGFIEASFRGDSGDSIIKLGFPSVGATEHLMTTAAMMAEKKTVIENCACEPEISDLQRFLVSMGAKVSGAGTPVIKIEGVKRTESATHRIIGDRIEAGTYMLAAMMTGGSLRIEGVEPSTLNFAAVLEKTGAKLSFGENSVAIRGTAGKPFGIVTGPYPGFPTDLQPQMTALACTANGRSTITETVFEKRFAHVGELKKMGAAIEIADRTIEITGVRKLHSASLTGKDLRNTAALTIAAAAADGISEIENFEILFRGYEKVLEKFNGMGIRIDTRSSPS